MNWYPIFLITVVVLWAFATPRDRIALRIVLLATLGSWALTEGVTRHIAAPWKLVFPAATETVTILALLRWTPNSTGYLQSACLAIAWVAHVLCYFDVTGPTDMVYSHYSIILGAVALGQIASCHDTIRNLIRRLGHWLYQFRPPRVGDIRPSGVSADLLRDTRP